MPKTSTEDRAWIDEAIRRVDADANRSADTHLHVLPIPVPGIELQGYPSEPTSAGGSA